jgi:reactive intermediate/imine deaminase
MNPNVRRVIVMLVALGAVFLLSRQRGQTPAAPTATVQAPLEVTFLNSEESRNLNLPFSEAVRVGDMIYVSGQIGTSPGSLQLVPGGIEAEARQTMENISAVLQRYGSSMNRVAKCTVFLLDMAEWPKFNEVYRTFFTGSFPARSALGANGLALGARVEVECVALAGGPTG